MIGVSETNTYRPISPVLFIPPIGTQTECHKNIVGYVFSVINKEKDREEEEVVHIKSAHENVVNRQSE